MSLITIRDFRDHAYARVLAAGASTTLGGHAVMSVEKSLYGFSLYLPPVTGFDTHEFTVSGPTGTFPADERDFLGEPPGAYSFELFQASAAAEWPGKVTILYADMPAVR